MLNPPAESGNGGGARSAGVCAVPRALAALSRRESRMEARVGIERSA